MNETFVTTAADQLDASADVALRLHFGVGSRKVPSIRQR